MTNITIKTPKGILEWCYLVEPKLPDNPNEKPQYKVKFVFFNKDEAVAFNSQFSTDLNEAAQSYTKGRFKTTPTGDSVEMTPADCNLKFPAKPEVIDKSPTGRWFMDISRAAEYMKEETLYKVDPIDTMNEEKDENGNWVRIDGSTVGNGSEGVCAVLKRPVFIKDGVISQPFWLQAVQVTKLVIYKKGQKPSDVF